MCNGRPKQGEKQGERRVVDYDPQYTRAKQVTRGMTDAEAGECAHNGREAGGGDRVALPVNVNTE